MSTELKNPANAVTSPALTAIAGRAGTANDTLISTTVNGLLTGSGATNGKLRLRGSSFLTDSGTIQCQDGVTSVSTLRAGVNSFQGPLTLDGGAGRIHAFAVADDQGSHGVWTVTADLTSGAGAGGQGYVMASTVKNPNAVAIADMGIWMHSLCATALQADGATATMPFAHSFTDLFSAQILNAGTYALTDHISFRSQPTYGAGGSVITRRGLLVAVRTGSVNPATEIGVDIESLTGTTAMSLRSSGTGVQLRHAGPVRIGDTAAAVEKLEVAGNILVTGTVYGSSASAETLDLQSTSHATRGVINLLDEGRLRTSLTTIGATTEYGLQFLPTLDLTDSLSQCVALNVAGTWTASGGLFNTHRLFFAQPTLTNSGANTIIPALNGISFSPTITAAVVNSQYVGGAGVVYGQPIFGVTGAGTWNTGTRTYDFASDNFVINAGTFDQRRGFVHTAHTGAGAIVTDIAIDIGTLAATTNNFSLRSTGTGVQMRHAGPGVFGASAAPTNTTSIALEVQSTTRAFLNARMTTTEREALIGVNGMLTYIADGERQTLCGRHNARWVEIPGWDVVISKEADQTVTNNGTLQDDDDLQFSVGANEAWIVECHLGLSGSNTTGDGDIGFTASGAAFVTTQSNWSGVFYGGTGTLTNQAPTAFATSTEAVTGGSVMCNGDGNIWPVHLYYRFRTSAAVTVKIQFCNSAAAAGRDTIMHAGSILRAKRMV
jgi:hypothetical protein